MENNLFSQKFGLSAGWVLASQGFRAWLLLLLLSHFSRVWLCVTPQTAAHQAPQSLGFSRQEHWLGWTIFSCVCEVPVYGKPLRCSCLENPRDGGAWWAAVYGVAQSRTRLKRLSRSACLNLLPRVLLGFLLTVNFSRKLFMYFEIESWPCIFIAAIFSCSGDLPVYFLMVSCDD